MTYRYLALLLPLIALSCNAPVSAPATSPDAQTEVREPLSEAERIVRESVEAGALVQLDEAAYTFRFRDKEYGFQKTGGSFTYERWWTDPKTGQAIRDVLTNEDFKRYVNDAEVTLTEKQHNAYSSSVNSVIYFAFMPYALLDPAANLTYLGRQNIQGEALDAIGVDFNQEGGGKDFEDNFRYWFEPDTRRLRYLAYVEAGNKEPRFREAYNERVEAGLTVRDYRNYHPGKGVRLPVDSLAPKFNRGELPLLSTIAIENVQRGTRDDRRE